MYGSFLASCSYDRKVYIWKEDRPGRWSRVYEYVGHESSVNSVCWAPAEFGLILACASSDGTISILTATSEANSWEAKKIQSAHVVGCIAVSWCPSLVPGSIIDSTKQPTTQLQKRLVSGGGDHFVKIWREEQDGRWSEEHKLEGHTDWVRDVAWAPTLGNAQNTIASCSQDCRVIIWQCNDLDSAPWTQHVLHEFEYVAWHVSWSVCGTILAVSGGENAITLWKETLEGEWRCISDSQRQKQRRTPVEGDQPDVSRG